MKLNIIGSILGTTGYDNHCRGLSSALYKLNPDIKLDVPLIPTWNQHVNDAELKMIKNQYGTPDVTIGIMTPPNWRIAMGDNCGKFIGFCVWEGSHIPKYWIEYLLDERVSQIWCPSLHTKIAIENTIEEWEGTEQNKILEKIKIVPHGYNPEIFKSNNSVRAPKDAFKFICNKGWRGGTEDRGGVQYVLQAFANEFKKDENVELTLKLNPAYINPQIIKQKIDELKLPKDAAKIKIVCADMNTKQIAELYNESDVCVCATRAEAFDLGTAEAMACGLPIITTGFGGQIEHMDKTCADFINFELQEVKGDVQYEGIKQGVPNVQNLRELLREAFLRRDITREKGENAKEYIKAFTWEKAAEKANNFLKEL